MKKLWGDNGWWVFPILCVALAFLAYAIFGSSLLYGGGALLLVFVGVCAVFYYIFGILGFKMNP